MGKGEQEEGKINNRKPGGKWELTTGRREIDNRREEIDNREEGD
jgi:hypothetical protein